MAAIKDDVISNLRAIIISSKGGLKVSEVAADYRETFGTDIPLKEMGYNSLEQFFSSQPENFKVTGTIVGAVTKLCSVHIASLVGRQKTQRRKGRSELSSKAAREIRRPVEKTKDPLYNIVPKRNQEIPYFRKHNIKEKAKTIQSENKVTLSKKNSETKISKLSQIQDIQNLEAPNVNLKEITRTFKNNLTVNTGYAGDKSSGGAVGPFEDVTDFSGTITSQLRMSKFRRSVNNSDLIDNKNNNSKNNNNNNNNNKVKNLNENLGLSVSPLGSPFRRSLANNSQQEIELAKMTATCNPKPKRGQTSPIERIGLTDGNKYENLLKQFCRVNGLIMPTYSIIIRETSDQAKCFGCILTMGDFFKTSTYPVEMDTEVSARELASKKAYDQLTSNNNLPAHVYDTEYVIKLRDLCAKKQLPDPVFKYVECHPKNQKKFFICKVRIGENILMSSYPVEALDEVSARDLAAMKAYNHLSQESKSPAGKSNNSDVTLDRIYAMVKDKLYGVWHNKLPNLYMDMFNEELQSDWFDLVQKSPKFDVSEERVDYIIRLKNSQETAEETVEAPVLASLKLPVSNQWEVYITNVVTSAEIWCRLIGKDYSEVYDSMMTKIELHPPTLNVKSPVVGGIYLVNLEESWNRVRVVDISQEEDKVSVFHIDLGVDEVVKKSQLFYLDKALFAVPPQAILLSLNELDALAENEQLQIALFHSLLGSTFIAEIVAILDEEGNVCSVNLWDTSTEEDINVNLKLVDDVIKTIKSLTLPPVGVVKEMYVSHIDDNGDVYLQSSKKNQAFMEWIISTKMKNSKCLLSVANQKIDMKKLYVTRSVNTGLFYRAKVLKTLDPAAVLVKFIDYGYEQKATLDDLLDLERSSFDLATIPSQAVQTRLNTTRPLSRKAVTQLRNELLEQNVLVKVTQIQPGCPPSVDLLKRSPIDGTLSSFSNKILNEDLPTTECLPLPRKKSYVIGLETTLAQHLPMPNIPPVGSYFNVFVTLAAHPGLINVQPLTTQNELMQLMFRLQERCEATFTKPLSPDDFKIGELYAVKHTDNFWYRAYAQAFTGSSSFIVCLCDFGDFVETSPDKLMPLTGEFKTFPYQAIRAYLAGVGPVDKDWTALDCVHFRELVVEKQFVSQIIEINRDVNNPNYISLGLILVDTSKQEDVYIHKLLLEKKMAVLKE